MSGVSERMPQQINGFKSNRKLATLIALLLSTTLIAQNIVTIPVTTKDNAMVLQTDKDGRLWITYFGKPVTDSAEYASAVSQYYRNDGNSGLYNSAYTPAGTWSLSEPALQVI